MKKYILIFSILSIFASCSTNQYDLEKMAGAVKSHLRYRDAEKGTITKIEVLDPVSYEKIPEDMRENPDEVYLCKIYMRGTWAYADSYRIYNIDDTIKSYFSKDKTFIRLDDDRK
ncbi:hypothetical protein [Prevotella sp. 10(H)]|uniref:hypothetical protein n=1 Tax=Prevotella sp. 10(H) TaxID=1158294 RepID=UPI0004A777AF|nr:hypothetical protein [Prevotella sp. 10(H)]